MAKPTAKQAQYRVNVPTIDTFGQPLHEGLAHAGHQWLRSQGRLFQDGWVEGPHHGLGGDVKHIVAIGEDSPESDSYVKQLAAHIGQSANHLAISASKTGPDGVETWIVPNRHFVEGQGADPEMLQRGLPESSPQSYGVQVPV